MGPQSIEELKRNKNDVQDVPSPWFDDDQVDAIIDKTVEFCDRQYAEKIVELERSHEAEIKEAVERERKRIHKSFDVEMAKYLSKDEAAFADGIIPQTPYTALWSLRNFLFNDCRLSPNKNDFADSLSSPQPEKEPLTYVNGYSNRPLTDDEIALKKAIIEEEQRRIIGVIDEEIEALNRCSNALSPHKCMTPLLELYCHKKEALTTIIKNISLSTPQPENIPDTMLASEEVLKKDWITPAEDEAWKDLTPDPNDKLKVEGTQSTPQQEGRLPMKTINNGGR